MQVQRKKIRIDPQGKEISVRPLAWGLIGVGLLIFLYAAVDALVVPGEKALLLPAEIYIHQPILETLLGVALISAVILSEVLPVFIMPPRRISRCEWCGQQWGDDERLLSRSEGERDEA